MIDDRMFDVLPGWYRDKIGPRGPILSDLARLYLIGQAFDDGFGHAIWADADLLVFEPDALRVPMPDDCRFGQETWVDRARDGRIKAWRNVHNAFMVFNAGSVTLPFLRYAVESIARRIDAQHIAPQTMGPKLLSALHNLVGFELMPEVGAFSPALLNDIVGGAGPFIDCLTTQQPVRPAAANLCASLARDPDQMLLACESLLTDSSVLRPA